MLLWGSLGFQGAGDGDYRWEGLKQGDARGHPRETEVWRQKLCPLGDPKGEGSSKASRVDSSYMVLGGKIKLHASACRLRTISLQPGECDWEVCKAGLVWRKDTNSVLLHR